MNFLSTTAAILLASSGAAFAEELHPACESVGEITVAVFEARVDGVPAEEAHKLANETDNHEIGEMISAVVEAAYALDIAEDDAEAEEQMVNFTADMILACEQGIRAS